MIALLPPAAGHPGRHLQRLVLRVELCLCLCALEVVNSDELVAAWRCVRVGGGQVVVCAAVCMLRLLTMPVCTPDTHPQPSMQNLVQTSTHCLALFNVLPYCRHLYVCAGTYLTTTELQST